MKDADEVAATGAPKKEAMQVTTRLLQAYHNCQVRILLVHTLISNYK
jgi:hypothetical protein